MRWSTVLLILVVAMFAIFALQPVTGPGLGYSSRASAKNAVIQLVTSAKAYEKEYGEPPQGDGKSVLRKLQGENPRKITFVELSPKDFSKDGSFLDPWGTEYVFDLSHTAEPWAYSFGKNKLDEGGNGDDVASWK